MLLSVSSGNLRHPLAGVGEFENSRINKCNRVMSNLSAFGGSPEARNNFSQSSSQITRFDLSCVSFVDFFFRVFSNVSGWMELKKNCFKTFIPSPMSNRASLRLSSKKKNQLCQLLVTKIVYNFNQANLPNGFFHSNHPV